MKFPCLYALLSEQGTACNETALCSHHYNPKNRDRIEAKAAKNGSPDAPIPNTWTDCSENDALECQFC